MPSRREIERAHAVFQAREPRDLFYKAATELIRLSDTGASSLSLAEALAVLLQTWNRAFYQFRGGFKETDFTALEALLSNTAPSLSQFRRRDIAGLSEGDSDVIEELFDKFADVLGPVGAAKSLHLLAPRFFPIWDRTIANTYGFHLPSGDWGGDYVTFMAICRAQCSHLATMNVSEPLKRMDEYNYCRFTTTADLRRSGSLK